jgi:drug/metabolite transporter (DMT)-like permease
LSQYEALKWVSFSVQLLVKSFKMIPVMLWAIAMSGKKYSVSEWLVTFVVTAGVVSFMTGGDISSKRAEAEWQSLYGVLLLLVWLLAETFAFSLSEKLFADHNTTKLNQILYVNLFSSLLAMLVLVASRELVPSLVFCTVHPTFPPAALALSGASVTGQIFTVSMVKDFGALALAATMNVRQLLSILLSTWTYGHHVTLIQILGLGIVFVALLAKNVEGICLKLRGPRLADEGKKGDTVDEGQERPEDEEEGQGRPEDEEAPPVEDGHALPVKKGSVASVAGASSDQLEHESP